MTKWGNGCLIKMLDFLHGKHILKLKKGSKTPLCFVEILKGDIAMFVAFGTFGAIYLAGMIAMTVRGLKV